jgi:hypothetical protein
MEEKGGGESWWLDASQPLPVRDGRDWRNVPGDHCVVDGSG